MSLGFMSHLKLVADNTEPALKEQAKPAEVFVASLQRKQEAARAILSLDLGNGQTVQKLVEEYGNNVHGPLLGADNDEQAREMGQRSHRNSQIWDVLFGMGIWVTASDEEQELNCLAYASVCKPVDLTKAFPALRKYADVLDKLPLAY
jgi:hypothetical protein